jgi:hypothetical protein
MKGKFTAAEPGAERDRMAQGTSRPCGDARVARSSRLRPRLVAAIDAGATVNARPPLALQPFLLV